jgi:cytochrome c biogenesis protein CcmG/thiol:disulfide interchange protein DsbE
MLTAMAQDGVRVVAIDYKDKPENALKFFNELGNPFAAVGVDQKGRSAMDWGVYGVPETFVVGPDGIIAFKHIGELTPQAVETKLKPAIAKAVTPGP